MTELAETLLPAIRLLEGDYEEAVRNANAILTSVNLLRARAGMPPRTPGAGDAGPAQGAGAVPAQIKPDTFYAKKLQTAVREYLPRQDRCWG